LPRDCSPTDWQPCITKIKRLFSSSLCFNHGVNMAPQIMKKASLLALYSRDTLVLCECGDYVKVRRKQIKTTFHSRNLPSVQFLGKKFSSNDFRLVKRRRALQKLRPICWRMINAVKAYKKRFSSFRQTHHSKTLIF
jgi:hypothetical protein